MERSPPPDPSRQQTLYEDAIADLGTAIDRLARSYEPDGDRWQDLRQDIHLALWRSFERYEGRCSLRTWTYRIAHNVATSHLIRRRRRDSAELVSLDAIEPLASDADGEVAVDRRMMLDRLNRLIQALAPLDRQLLLLYLEGVDASSIGEITGLSPSNVSVKVHRIKKVIAARLAAGGRP
jgi:RNA polymerase sigma-70 factor, ECF subfamily